MRRYLQWAGRWAWDSAVAGRWAAAAAAAAGAAVAVARWRSGRRSAAGNSVGAIVAGRRADGAKVGRRRRPPAVAGSCRRWSAESRQSAAAGRWARSAASAASTAAVAAAGYWAFGSADSTKKKNTICHQNCVSSSNALDYLQQVFLLASYHKIPDPFNTKFTSGVLCQNQDHKVSPYQFWFFNFYLVKHFLWEKTIVAINIKKWRCPIIPVNPSLFFKNDMLNDCFFFLSSTTNLQQIIP